MTIIVAMDLQYLINPLDGNDIIYNEKKYMSLGKTKNNRAKGHTYNAVVGGFIVLENRVYVKP